jgi:hydrogenase maturation protease
VEAAECRILVAGIGNVFRSDDGFGTEVARRLSGLPWPDGVRVVDYGIRGMHLAYDLLEAWDALILIDALPDRGEVGTVVLIEIGAEDVGAGTQVHAPSVHAPSVDAPSVDAHAMDPATVLATLAALGGRLPARTLLVGCQVAETGDGMGLTPPVDAAVDEAVSTVHTVVTRELRPTGVA